MLSLCTHICNTCLELKGVRLFCFLKNTSWLLRALFWSLWSSRFDFLGFGRTAEGTATDRSAASAAASWPAASSATSCTASTSPTSAPGAGTGSSAATGSSADCSNYCGQHSSIGKKGRAWCLWCSNFFCVYRICVFCCLWKVKNLGQCSEIKAISFFLIFFRSMLSVFFFAHLLRLCSYHYGNRSWHSEVEEQHWWKIFAKIFCLFQFRLQFNLMNSEQIHLYCQWAVFIQRTWRIKRM